MLSPQAASNLSTNWNFTTVPQEGLLGRSVPYPRGKIVGGTSKLNFLLYARGSAEDYDRSEYIRLFYMAKILIPKSLFF